MPDARVLWSGGAAFYDQICPPYNTQECHTLDLLTIPSAGTLTSSAVLYVAMQDQTNKVLSLLLRDSGGTLHGQTVTFLNSHSNPGTPFGAITFLAFGGLDTIPLPGVIQTTWCHIEGYFAHCGDVEGSLVAAIVDEGVSVDGRATAVSQWQKENSTNIHSDIGVGHQVGRLIVSAVGSFLVGFTLTAPPPWFEIVEQRQTPPAGGPRNGMCALAAHPGDVEFPPPSQWTPSSGSTWSTFSAEWQPIVPLPPPGPPPGRGRSHAQIVG